MNFKELFITNKTNFRIAGALLAIVVIVFIVAFTKSYDVATVNGASITARQFSANYRMSSFLVNNIRKANATTTLMSDNELKAIVLTELIERSLVESAVKAEVGDDLNDLVARKVEKYANDATLKNAALTLYGGTFEEYKQEVLIPQAERDILAGRLYLKKQTYDAWAVEAKKSAHVEIFSKDFFWNGSVVKGK